MHMQSPVVARKPGQPGSLAPKSLARRIARRLMRWKYPANSLQVERAEHRFYLDYLREGMTVFDVGANFGEVTLLFSRFVGGGGHVHSFEASSEVYGRLRQMCDIAGRTNISINHAAVADAAGVVQLHVYDREYSGWNSLADRPLANYGIDVKPIGVENVESTTIDDYCDEHGIDHIDLLKIDVEGAEYQVLLGARRMLQEKRVGCCVFEFGQTTFDMGNTPEEIRGYLNSLGYRIRNIVPGDPLFPGGTGVETARFSIHVAVP